LAFTYQMPLLDFELGLAYGSIIFMALIPIYFGSFLSLKTIAKESISRKDSLMFPVIASCFLFGLYLLFKIFQKDWINLIFLIYFVMIGAAAVFATLRPLTKWIASKFQRNLRTYHFKFTLPFYRQHPTKIQVTVVDVLNSIVTLLVCVWYLTTKNWISNNILGLCFCVQGIARISLGEYLTAVLLLSGLFVYDIFWVFGTDVMVTVARSFDVPVKLLFPKALFDPARVTSSGLSMLGLGDVVLPGLFIAFLLRYDAQKYGKKTKFYFPYFQFTFIAYFFGLLITITVMHIWKAAQPALLYLVPAVVGTSVVVALLRGDLRNLLKYREGKEQTDSSRPNRKTSKSPSKQRNFTKFEQNHKSTN
jgi:minor histocompatibility antigen H13